MPRGLRGFRGFVSRKGFLGGLYCAKSRRGVVAS